MDPTNLKSSNNIVSCLTSFSSSLTSNGKATTLKQLIPVHEAFLDSISTFFSFSSPLGLDLILDVTKGSSDLLKSKDNSGNLELILTILICDPAERKKCYGDDFVLLIVQYLLRLSKKKGVCETEIIFRGLVDISIPLLLDPLSNLSNELRDAIIDVSFHLRGSSNGDVLIPGHGQFGENCGYLEQLVQDCTDQTLNSVVIDGTHCSSTSDLWIKPFSTTNNAKVVVEAACLILQRMHLFFDDAQSQNGEIATANSRFTKTIVEAIHRLNIAIINSTCYTPVHKTANSNGKMSLFRSVTALLLPTLYPPRERKSNSDGSWDRRVFELWELLAKLIKCIHKDKCYELQVPVITTRRCRNWEAVFPAVVTGIFSVITPSIISLPLCIQSLSNKEEVGSLVRHKLLWDFIQSSLISFKDMKGESGRSCKSQVLDGYEDEIDDNDGACTDQIVRRRSIYVLGLLIDQEWTHLRNSGKSSSQQISISIWKKFVLCFEALEMEVEIHLVDQIWDTVQELCTVCCNNKNQTKLNSCSDKLEELPPMSWEWVSSLFGRILLSEKPNLRKFALFRFLNGSAGIANLDIEETVEMNVLETSRGNDRISTKIDQADQTNNVDDVNAQMNESSKYQRAKKDAKNYVEGTHELNDAPTSIVSTSFIFSILIPSFDSLWSSVGTIIQYEENGKTVDDDISVLFELFITNYVKSLLPYPKRMQTFTENLLQESCINVFHAKTILKLFRSTVSAWSYPKFEDIDIIINSKMLEQGVKCLSKMFGPGSMPQKMREALLADFAILLSHTLYINNKPEPLLLLKTLEFFPSPVVYQSSENVVSQALQKWLSNIGDSFAENTGAATAAAFVSGNLVPFSECSNSISNKFVMLDNDERSIGASISKLCALACLSESSSSYMLWPAINKGLSYAHLFVQEDSSTCTPTTKLLSSQALRQISRATILLEKGCIERVISGMGNGDIVMDKNGIALPPPPEIERLLSLAINFVLDQIQSVSLCGMQEIEDEADQNELPACGARSGISNSISNQFTFLTNQLIVLKQSFPSSVTISATVESLLNKSLETLFSIDRNLESINLTDQMVMVKNVALLFACLSSGGTCQRWKAERNHTLGEYCSMLLQMQFVVPTANGNGQSQVRLKAVRSAFQYAKWGALSFLVPEVISEAKDQNKINSLNEDILNIAQNSINATPANALLPLFETIVICAKEISEKKLAYCTKKDKMNNIISTLFSAMMEAPNNPTKSYMLNVTCSIVFRPRLLIDEYDGLQERIKSKKEFDDNDNMPILNAFRHLVKMASTRRPHISKAVLMYISVAWLGQDFDCDETTKGLCAIPYALDIAQLLVHKEMKQDECSTHQESLVHQVGTITHDCDYACLPSNTDDSSIVRGFVLIFLSKLPSMDKISKEVLENLCHFIIFWLLNNICCLQPKKGTMLVTGSTEYCQKIRAWQALCLLHRFVTSDIVGDVCEKVFSVMSQSMHTQIRYFIEIFIIQCARKHPDVFCSVIAKEISRRNLSLQHISSLMIISGNLIVGKYSVYDFSKPVKTEVNSIIKNILTGTLPWLSSSQGFSRAIAQLLVHKLVPLILHENGLIEEEDTCLFKSIWLFLDENSEIKRLRKKQSRFFEKYDADSVCSAEGLLQIPIDEGGEANPVNLVDMIKQTQQEVYAEARLNDAPTWKHVDDILGTDQNNVLCVQDDMSKLVNFQRKILPLDSLNLAIAESNEQRARNGAGRKKQDLIVCATLIDKVPNLAGLARSAEIFSAEMLVIPDTSVCKMDNFKSVSVGAADWINIEECKEDDLLQWLKSRKEDGFTIVGVEQTSSSISLSNLVFPKKTVLLLGKEKEGIPVKYLQSVDICVEIPQLGIIRSLNVHVSGAICIWEYTKQMNTLVNGVDH